MSAIESPDTRRRITAVKAADDLYLVWASEPSGQIASGTRAKIAALGGEDMVRRADEDAALGWADEPFPTDAYPLRNDDKLYLVRRRHLVEYARIMAGSDSWRDAEVALTAILEPWPMAGRAA